MPIRWLSRSLFGDSIKCVVSSIKALVLLHTPSSYGILVVSPSLNSQYKWVSPWCLTRPAYCAWSRHFDGNTKEHNWNGVRSMKKWDTVDCTRKYYISPPRGGAREFPFPRLGPRVLSSSPVRYCHASDRPRISLSGQYTKKSLLPDQTYYWKLCSGCHFSKKGSRR